MNNKLTAFGIIIVVLISAGIRLYFDANVRTLNEIECHRNTGETPFCSVMQSNLFIKNKQIFQLKDIKSASIVQTNSNCLSSSSKSKIYAKCHFIVLNIQNKLFYLDKAGKETQYTHDVPDLDKKVSDFNNFLNNKSISSFSDSIDRREYFVTYLPYFLVMIVLILALPKNLFSKEPVEIKKELQIINKLDGILEVIVRKQLNFYSTFIKYFLIFIFVFISLYLYYKNSLSDEMLRNLQIIGTVIFMVSLFIFNLKVQFYHRFEINKLKNQLILYKDRLIRAQEIFEIIKFKGFIAHYKEVYNIQDIVDVKYISDFIDQKSGIKEHYLAIKFSNNKVAVFALNSEDKCIQDGNYRLEVLKEIYANLNLKSNLDAGFIKISDFYKDFYKEERSLNGKRIFFTCVVMFIIYLWLLHG